MRELRPAAGGSGGWEEALPGEEGEGGMIGETEVRTAMVAAYRKHSIFAQGDEGDEIVVADEDAARAAMTAHLAALEAVTEAMRKAGAEWIAAAYAAQDKPLPEILAQNVWTAMLYAAPPAQNGDEVKP